MILSWVEISKKSLLRNISEIKKNLSKKTKFFAVLKSNAYGHGLLEVYSQIKNQVDGIIVFTFEDALFLRGKKFKKSILVVSHLFEDQVDLAIKNNIEFTVSTLDVLKNIKKKLAVHICVDSGLGRDGFVEADRRKVIELLKKSPLQVKGLYAHFASADDSKFDDYTKKQSEELLVWKKEFAKVGLNPLIHHSATAASFLDVGKNFDAVRIGLGIYGLWPSSEVKKREEKSTKLSSVLSWKSRVIEVKNLKKGDAISYGCTHILKRDSRVAVIPVGYFDGIPRSSSNQGFVIIKGQKVPQLGRVTMNLIVVDVTDLKNVKQGDLVTIIGREKNVEITADDWAQFAQTSSYEITTRINSNLPRVFNFLSNIRRDSGIVYCKPDKFDK